MRHRLSVATACLLSMDGSLALAESLADWQFEASYMRYAEANRITVNESIIAAKRELDNESIRGTIIYDSMSGASPNGAVPPSDSTQTYTSPSGSIFQVAPDELPADEFKDRRTAFSLAWSVPVMRTVQASLSGLYSTETDYLSYGSEASLAWDINTRLTTLVTALSANWDTSKPIGGIPTGFTPGSNTDRYREDNKFIMDWMVGVKQVINRRSYLQLNYGFGKASGYLSDPYKVISFVSGATGEPIGARGYYFEKRPDSRTQQNLYLRLVSHINDTTYQLAYRYYEDDWGVRSHTFHGKFIISLTPKHVLEPALRHYRQQAANFYHYALYDGPGEGVLMKDVVNASRGLSHASADYRLGELTTHTIGVKYLYRYKQGHIGLRINYLRQQDQRSLFTTVQAWISQVIFKLRF